LNDWIEARRGGSSKDSTFSGEDPIAAPFSHALHGRLAGARTSVVGGWRILYEIRATPHVLDVIAIGPRGDIYKR
jgi:mRNA-degrading endonuclease RelE of RelBE toxin-antitoxin system